MFHFLFRQIVVYYKTILQQYFAQLSLEIHQAANAIRYPATSLYLLHSFSLHIHVPHSFYTVRLPPFLHSNSCTYLGQPFIIFLWNVLVSFSKHVAPSQSILCSCSMTCLTTTLLSLLYCTSLCYSILFCILNLVSPMYFFCSLMIVFLNKFLKCFIKA